MNFDKTCYTQRANSNSAALKIDNASLEKVKA